MEKNVAIGVLVVAIVLGGGYFLMSRNNVVDDTIPPVDNTVVDVTLTPTPTPAPTPTPTPKPTPDAPIVQTGTGPAVSSSTAAVSGKVNPNGVSTTYWFEYGEATTLTSRTNAQQIGSGYYLLPAPGYITGLKANTIYYFRLAAKNSFATVYGTTYTFQTNSTPPSTVKAPTVSTNNATGISRMDATLNGGVNPNGSQASYWFEYGKSTSFGNVTTYLETNNGSTTMSVSVALSGLEPLTKYYFRMNAQNQYGTVNGTMLNFTTTGPAVPTAPTVSTTSATNITTSNATLGGRINPNGAETTYWFEYSQDSLLGTLIGGGTSTQILNVGNSNVNVTTNLSSLNNNTKYYYRLIARNSSGIVNGDIMSFRTKN